MGSLTHEFLRDFLSKAFVADKKTIVPKQANWWNPQDFSEDGEKVPTWCAFKIARSIPVTFPGYQVNNSVNISSVVYKSEIEIQLVGSLAEANANAMAHWWNREDLKYYLEQNDMQFMNPLGNFKVSNFYQEGLNNVFAYNCVFWIQWTSTIDTSQTIVDTVNINGGGLIIPNT